MLVIALLLASAPGPPVLAPSAADTAFFLVLNHGRPAGEMLVVSRGDSLVVRYHHVDRNRGPRSETRYLIRNGRVLGGETWGLPLYGPEPPRGKPADRFEILRDSVFWRVGDSARAASLTPASYYQLRSFTPFDQALLARFLLSRPDRTAQLLPSGTAKLEIVADTTVRTAAGRQRVRLAMIQRRAGPPDGVWLDERDNLFASEMSWFITVRPGNQQALPALRKIELRYRNAAGEALAPSSPRRPPAPSRW